MAVSPGCCRSVLNAFGTEVLRLRYQILQGSQTRHTGMYCTQNNINVGGIHDRGVLVSLSISQLQIVFILGKSNFEPLLIDDVQLCSTTRC